MSDTNLKYVRIAVVIIIAVLAIGAVLIGSNQQMGVSPTSAAVEVPEAINTAIQIGVVALLTAGFAWLFQVLGIDLRGLAPTLGLAISAWVVSELQNVVNLIPAQFDPFVNTFFYFLILILAPIGALKLVRKKEEGEPSYKLI